MLGKQAGLLMNVTVPLTKNVFIPLAIMTLTSAIDGAIQKKMRGRRVVRAGKGISLVISNEDINEIMKIIKSAKN